MHDRIRHLSRGMQAWLRLHDPGLAAARRAGRTAIVAPALFAVGLHVVHSTAFAYYAAFGCFSMLLFVDFTGPMAQRVRAHCELAFAWALLVCLGTLAAPETWVAVVATVVVAFVILFSGVVSSVLAGASTALLLAFVIPVSAPVDYSQLPDRLAGVGAAAAGSMLAIWVWPRTSTDPLSAPAARVCRTAAAVLRAEVALRGRDPDGAGIEPHEVHIGEVVAAGTELRRAFDRAANRPTGLSAGSRALVKLVDELTWLGTTIAGSLPPQRQVAEIDFLHLAVADLLDNAAALLADPHGEVSQLQVQIHSVRGAMDSLVQASAARLPARLPNLGPAAQARAYLGILDGSFRAKELGYVALQVAGNVERVARAERRSWPERLLGRETGELGGPATSARERAHAHLRTNSVWLHNSLRGAAGLGVAVTLVDLTSVQHSFWVLLGTLSVLRSNALSTGQSVLRAMTGTVVGSIIGAGLLQLIGHHIGVLWLVLPIAVFMAGIAPAAISFAAGQAAFTVTLVVIFSIGQDNDWHIALLRVQDIALGCVVSLLVALFFWPRGAAAAVGRALAEAYMDSATFLVASVEYGLNCSGGGQGGVEEPVRKQHQVAAAARRLDDAFRSYIVERGAKPIPLAGMTTLVTGVARLRLEADAVIALWRRAGEVRLDTAGTDARLELLMATESVADWYRSLAEAIDERTPIPDPIDHDATSAIRLAESVQRDLRDQSEKPSVTAVRMIWTRDYVESARRLQSSVAAAATAAFAKR